MTGRILERTLWLPFESIRTLYENSSEVRLYRNEITDVQQIGKRVSAIGKADEAIVFREAQLLQSIRHNNVVPVHDVAIVDDEDADELMTVIEMIIPYYSRGSVYDTLERGERVSIGEAVRLTREALIGLGILHEQHNILHRDIKSANVFIDDGGTARVGDLGVAVTMDADRTAEPFPGGQMYSPPETYTGERVSRAADIYGMGLMMHELLSGPFPYEDYTRADVLARLEDGKRAVRNKDLTMKPWVSPPLRRVVTKATNVDPSRRFQSAAEMIDALDHADFIDWSLSRDESNTKEWTGPAASDSSGPTYRITASFPWSARRQLWRIQGHRRVTSWRRCVADQAVASVDDSETRAFFDQVFRNARNR